MMKVDDLTARRPWGGPMTIWDAVAAFVGLAAERDRALAAAKELRAALKDAADTECLNGCAELPDSVDGFREHTEVCGRWNTTLAATAWLEDR